MVFLYCNENDTAINESSNISLAFTTVVDPAQGKGGGGGEVLALLGELRGGPSVRNWPIQHSTCYIINYDGRLFRIFNQNI